MVRVHVEPLTKINMKQIKTRHDIEIFAASIAVNIVEIPENFRLVLILSTEDFQSLVTEINPQLVIDKIDRFIYNSHSGIEFGIKQQL